MSDIRVETAERVMTITLNRAAKKNAITDAMYGDIADALDPRRRTIRRSARC